MPWIPWIQIEKDDTSKEDVKRVYGKARNSLTGKMSDLTRLTSLTPEVAHHLDRPMLRGLWQCYGLDPAGKRDSRLGDLVLHWLCPLTG